MCFCMLETKDDYITTYGGRESVIYVCGFAEHYHCNETLVHISFPIESIKN